MFRIRGLTKRYGDRAVLQDISVEIAPRTFTAVLGPSGAGKTTLMRCLMGLVQPEQGEIWYGDRDFGGHDIVGARPQDMRRIRRQMAVVAQQFNLVRRRTALDNCLAGRLPELPLWRCLLSWFPQSLKRDALMALERVQLLDVALQRADRLSGGQQQRVAIARAITQKARLILADEPISSLDPESARIVLDLLRSLCDREGITVICNLHQASLALEYSDRILGMKSGQLVLDKAASDMTEFDLDALYQSGRQGAIGTFIPSR
ncbi:MAG: phosphonate ABC transporter ATP-binding protein [Cyanobacteria bacterium P01_E01_bin.45]